jgi:putative adenylate-forming enzyme
MAPKVLTPFRVLWKRRALERDYQWHRPALEAHQQECVHELRRFAAERSPFYQRFHSGLENRPLHELPVLTKTTLMESFDGVVTDRAVRLADLEAHLREGGGLFRGRYTVLATSGSTGRRGIFLFNPAEWLQALAFIARPMAWAGLTRSLVKPPRAAFIASTTPWHYSAQVSASLVSRLLPALRLDAVEPVETMVRRLNEWQPETLAAYPSVLRQLAEEQIAGRLRVSFRSIGTSAEVLTDETRRRVKQAWGVPVYDTYGATEYAPIAAECAHGRKHLFEDGAVIEIVDDQGKPVPPGELGDRILLTVFNRWTQPLIRYEISDMVRPVSGECECGRKLQLIERVEGRIEEILRFPSRAGATVSVHPNVFHQALETAPVAGWQVVLDADGLSVLVTGLREASWAHELPRTLNQLLEAQGAVAPTIRVCPVDTLQRGATGKAPVIFSRLPKPLAGRQDASGVGAFLKGSEARSSSVSAEAGS